MKHPQLILSCLASLLIAAHSNASVIPENGQDKRIEWENKQSWQTSSKTLDMVHSLDGKYVYILNDKQQIQVFSHEGQLQGNIPVAKGVSVIDIAPRGELLYVIDNEKQTFSTVAVSFVVDIDTAGSPFRGPENAPVTITLFTDFECPYCNKVRPLLDQMLEKNQETVKLVFKNMPLSMHKMAEPAARAAFAAQEQGKFWEFHDKLFDQPKITPETFTIIATELGLDLSRFEKDLNSAAIKAKLRKDLADAQKAGVTGTPSIFVNGRVLQERSPSGFRISSTKNWTK